MNRVFHILCGAAQRKDEYNMEEYASDNLEKLLSLSKEELEKIFSQLSVEEVEDLLNKLYEVDNND